MCDVFPFASIDSSCFGFHVGSSLSSSLIFPVCFLRMCDVFPFASIYNETNINRLLASPFPIQVVLGSVWVPVSPVTQ